MPDFITLSCPACGGKLEITNDVERFACSHCGREHLVRRGGGAISLAPILDTLQRVEASTGRTASELAIVRLKKEIAELQAARHAILDRNPKPAPSALFVFPVMIGSLSLCIGAVALMDNNARSFSFLAFGFVVALIGIVPLVFMRPDTKPWENTIGTQIKSLDAQLTAKSAELQRNQKVVSS